MRRKPARYNRGFRNQPRAPPASDSALATKPKFSRIQASSHVTGLTLAALVVLAVHVVGTVGYKLIGGPQASWFDSFYMTFITVATIGYTEVIDLTGHPGGRIFTVVIAFIGIGAMTYVFSTVTAMILESDLNQTLRRKRMNKAIGALSGHYIICGIGRVGTNVAGELLRTGRSFAIIEESEHALESYVDSHPEALFVHGDGADDDMLIAAGIERAAGVFAVTGDDSHNIVVSLSVKQLNPNVRVVARVHDIRNADKARRAGADEIVSPDFTGGMRIASAMIRPHVVSFMDQMLRRDDGLRVEEVLVPAGTPPRPLGALADKARDFILMATHRRGEWVFNPAQEYRIEAGDALVIMTNPAGRGTVEQMLRAGA
jgi:voltage-gated potassium channel